MGISNLAAFARSRGCLTTLAVEKEDELRPLLRILTCICFDFNTELHRCCAKYDKTTDAYSVVASIRAELCSSIAKQVAVLVYLASAETVDVLVAMDGASPPGKRPEQKRRRRQMEDDNNGWSEYLTAGSLFLKELFDASFRASCCAEMIRHVSCQGRKIDLNFYYDSDQRPNEGEIKCLDFIERRHSRSTSVVITTDNDVLASVLMRPDQSVIMLTRLPLPTIPGGRPMYGLFMTSNREVSAKVFSGNGVLTSWFGALLFAVFGGDYLPRYLAASSARQMDRLKDFLLESKLLVDEDDPLQLVRTREGARRFVKVVLSAFVTLTKCRRMVSSRNNRHCGWLMSCHGEESMGAAKLLVEWFMSDLLWTVGHYSCRIPVPHRTGFLVEVEDESLMFSALPNTYFLSLSPDSLDYDKIYSEAFVIHSYHPEWNNLLTFRNELF
jgi:hypothetical protein